jgi:hypothetical protein
MWIGISYAGSGAPAATAATAAYGIVGVRIRTAHRLPFPLPAGILALRPGVTQQTGQGDEATAAQGTEERAPIDAPLGYDVIVGERLGWFLGHEGLS